MITFPFWFKIFLGCFGMLIISGAIRRLYKNKYLDGVSKLSPEKKNKLIENSSFLVKILKIFLWLLPINLILVPSLVYKYSPSDFFHIFVMMCIIYILVAEEFLFRRSVLLRLNLKNKD